MAPVSETPETLAIVQVGHPVLRAQARPLTPAEILEPSTQALIEAMREIMREAPGVGLAAPQLGLPLQLAVVEDRPEYMRGMSGPGAQRARARGVALSGADQSRSSSWWIPRW